MAATGESYSIFQFAIVKVVDTLTTTKNTNDTKKENCVFVFFVVEKDFRTTLEHMSYRAESVNSEMKDAYHTKP